MAQSGFNVRHHQRGEERQSQTDAVSPKQHDAEEIELE